MATKKNTESEQVEAITEETIAEEPKPVAKKPRARKAENAPKEKEGFGAEEVPMAENEGEPLMESDLSEEEIASEVAEDLKAEQENGFALTGREISRAGYVNDLTGTTMDETFARIMSLKRRGVICSSKVAAVRKKGGPIPFDAVVLDYRGIPVSIAFDDFFEREEIESALYASKADVERGYSRAEALNRRLALMARDMLGATVCFIITEARRTLDKENLNMIGMPTVYYAVRGSRIAAMEKLRERNFFSPRARKSPIKVGDVVTCDILRTLHSSVFVSSCGVVARMFGGDLSATRWCDPKNDFTPGDSFNAVVREISVDYEKGTVTLALDRKFLDCDMADAYLRMLGDSSLHNHFSGTIAYISMDAYGQPRFYGINLDAIHVRGLVPVKYNNYQNLRRGDAVIFKPRTVDWESHVLVGRCDPMNTMARNNW